MTLNARRPTERFSDLPINMDEHPIRKDLVPLTGEEAIKRSVKNLMFTDRYERPFHPRKGAGLKAYLFENVNSLTAGNIRARIIDTITEYEPRVDLREVVVYVMPDENAYTAKIVFSIKNSPEPITLDIILTRIR